MAISLDLLNSTFEDFRGPLVLAMEQNLPVVNALVKKGRVLKSSGKYIERPVGVGSPARATGIYNGDEIPDRTRRQIIRRMRVDMHRIVAAVVIPNKDLKQNSGKAGALSLINEYPRAFSLSFAVDKEKYMLTGSSKNLAVSSEDLYGYLTLNGQHSVSGYGTGVENGVLDFEDPSTQTDVVQNVAKSLADMHYNQYGHISVWATDGVRTLRKVYRACAQYSGKPGGAPDLVFMDDDTYGNFQMSKMDLVRLSRVQTNTDKGSPVSDVFMQAGVYATQMLEPATDFTGPAATGVTYMLNSDWIEINRVEQPSWSKFQEDPIQDGVVARYSEHEAWFFHRLPAHGCVSGGMV